MSKQYKKVSNRQSVEAAPVTIPQPTRARELPFVDISDGTLESDVAALLKYGNPSAMADFVRTFGRATPKNTTTTATEQSASSTILKGA